MICLNSDKYISQKQASEIANVSRMTIWRYAKAGHISTRTNINRISQYSMRDTLDAFGVPYSDAEEATEKWSAPQKLIHVL